MAEVARMVRIALASLCLTLVIAACAGIESPAKDEIPRLTGLALPGGACGGSSSVTLGQPGLQAAAALQHAKDALDSRIVEFFGEDSKGTPHETLAKGLIGVAVDDADQQLVIVVDAAMVDVSKLQANLDGIANAEHAKFPAVAEISVRVQAGCHSAADLLRAASVIDQRAWHPQAGETAYTVTLDPGDSSYHVFMPAGAVKVGEALTDQLGTLVTVIYTDGKPVHDDL